MTTTLLDPAAPAAVAGETECIPATCRIGLLGLGNVGSAFARHAREAAAHLAARGFAPIVATALVRTTSRPRAAASFVTNLTSDIDAFFAEPLDVVVEALGGVEPAYTFVRRALDLGIPVVTANKSLVAARGDELAQLARRRATALRYEASCIAGVPFLGGFERRPLAARAAGVTAILNGTSNSILTAMTSGTSFDAALADAQRLGFAEPDPSMDISGADAAEKLAILIRVFGRLVVDPAALAARRHRPRRAGRHRRGGRLRRRDPPGGPGLVARPRGPRVRRTRVRRRRASARARQRRDQRPPHPVSRPKRRARCASPAPARDPTSPPTRCWTMWRRSWRSGACGRRRRSCRNRPCR